MSLPKWLCWLDIETNGRPVNEGGLLLEVACVITASSINDNGVFQPVGEFHSLVYNTDLEEIKAGTPAYVYNMHVKSGLWEDFKNLYSYPVSEVQFKMLDFLRQFEGTMAIIGSGVGHFDVPFLKVVMPDVINRMEYYSIDIGSFGRILEMTGIHDDYLAEIKEANAGNHRSKGDIAAFMKMTEKFVIDLVEF